MKRLILILITIIFIIGISSCASNRLITYKPNHKCSTYNDVTDLHKRQDIPRSLRNDYPKHYR